MSDISNQLIKDSYNYVLQSDLSTGVVYRIGGNIPVNPKFISGLTINSNFNYSNGTEQSGFVLITDASGNASWGPISGDYLPLSGGTVSGATNFTGGLTANTISATTYLGLSNLSRQEFTYTTGVQEFMLLQTPAAIYNVFVNGQELFSTQYGVSGNVITIIDTLVNGDTISVIYSDVPVNVPPSYTKVETDNLLLGKEDLTNKATNLTSPDNTKYPTTQAVVNALGEKKDKFNFVTDGIEYFNDFEGSLPTTGQGSNDSFAIDGKIGKYGNSTSITYPIFSGLSSSSVGVPLLQSTGANSWIGLGNRLNNCFLLGNGLYEFNTMIALNNIPDSTNRIAAIFGLTDSVIQTVASTNAVAFILEQTAVLNANTASPNWQCITFNGGIKTITTTSVVGSTNFVKLTIKVNENASSVEFLIDNSVVATHTTNIPTTVRLANFLALNKISIGTIPMGFYIDYLHYKYTFTNKRI
jgi:hypothetical protein